MMKLSGLVCGVVISCAAPIGLAGVDFFVIHQNAAAWDSALIDGGYLLVGNTDFTSDAPYGIEQIPGPLTSAGSTTVSPGIVSSNLSIGFTSPSQTLAIVGPGGSDLSTNGVGAMFDNGVATGDTVLTFTQTRDAVFVDLSLFFALSPQSVVLSAFDADNSLLGTQVVALPPTPGAALEWRGQVGVLATGSDSIARVNIGHPNGEPFTYVHVITEYNVPAPGAAVGVGVACVMGMARCRRN